MSDVTVIIPTHNRRKLLARTLHSVLAQTDVDLAVVVVDDGGSDDTQDFLRDHPDARVRSIRHPVPLGVSAARNSGIAAATTRWVAFTDDDDLWAPDKLRSQLDALAADPSARWSCTGSVNLDLGCQVSLSHYPLPDHDVGAALLRLNPVPGGGSGVLAERELAEAVGGFDEAISNLADWDFYIRLGLAARVAPVHSLQIGYLVHATGMAHNIPRSEREYRYLDVKYERDRRRLGVERDDVNWLSYLAGLAYHSGRRRASIRLHAELAGRHRQWRSVRSVAGTLTPAAFKRARQRRWMPTGAPESVAAWLAPYKSGWLD